MRGHGVRRRRATELRVRDQKSVRSFGIGRPPTGCPEYLAFNVRCSIFEVARSIHLVIGKDKAFNAPIVRNGFPDFRHVGNGNAAVKEMIGLNKDGDAGCALIETARSANTRCQFRQAARGQLRF